MAYGSSPITYESDLSHRLVTDRPHEFPNFHWLRLAPSPTRGRGRGGKFFESKTATIDSKPVDSLSNRTRRSVANATIILARVAFDPGLEPMGQNEGNGFVEPQPDYFGRTTLGDDLSHPRRSHATRYGEHINNNFTVSSMEIQIRSFLFGGRHVLEVSISVVVVISPRRCDARALATQSSETSHSYYWNRYQQPLSILRSGIIYFRR